MVKYYKNSTIFLFLNVLEIWKVQWRNYFWMRFFLGWFSSLLKIKLNTHFQCCTACQAPHHTCQAPCMAFPWKHPSFVAQNYLRVKPAASWENEEEIWSPALARGSPESRAVTVRATTLKSWLLNLSIATHWLKLLLSYNIDLKKNYSQWLLLKEVQRKGRMQEMWVGEWGKLERQPSLCLLREPCLCQDWLRMLKLFRYKAASALILNVK